MPMPRALAPARPAFIRSPTCRTRIQRRKIAGLDGMLVFSEDRGAASIMICRNGMPTFVSNSWGLLVAGRTLEFTDGIE